MNKKNIVIFVLIIIIASFLRLYKIVDIPPGVNRDEASIGYTAYSILNTGRDEYGRLFPFSLQSFGDWKLPLYIYTVVPFVSFFGLSELAVRLPSAFFGILSVILTFYLIKTLFKNNTLAFLAMFLAAISPWSIHLSRVESESNTAVFLTLAGVILFLKSLDSKRWLIIPGSIFLALTYFTYAGNHIFTTLLVLGLTFIYRKQITKTRINLVALFIFLILSGFIFYNTLFGADKTKLSGIGIFGDPSVVHAKIELPRLEHVNFGSFFTRLVHNRVVFAMERFGQNYVNAFSGEFLFTKGGTNNAHNIANFGNMYLIEAPFLFLGLVYLIAIKKGKEKSLILFWFLISPIAASITKDAPHTNRKFAIFPMFSLISVFGIYYLLTEIIRQNLLKKIFLGFIVGLFIINASIYLDRYYVHFPKNEARSWGVGYKALNNLLSQPSFVSKKVIMERPKYSPYIYLLFYSKYSPSLYQKQAMRYSPTEDGFVDVREFDRYEFRKIDWNKDLSKDTVLVAWSTDVPKSIKNKHKTQEITLENGESMFTIIDPNSVL
ncbi:MAG: phospholipid carrier-dependent glycosyltransferase [Candidatus Levybacteria bacterium]|nr:phospholipid carrier-dependent glycosyltransferase [Candidatus Levybacteria bacterium]